MTQLDRLIIGDGEYVSYPNAVKTIERLNAEIARQRAEIERLQAAKRNFSTLADERAKEAAELRAEIERLRAALSVAAEWLEAIGHNFGAREARAAINA